MANKNYRKGARAEYLLKKELTEEGYTVLRTAGSHGPFDLIAIGKDCIRLIQVKVTDLPKAGRMLQNFYGAPPPVKVEAAPNLSQELWVRAGGTWHVTLSGWLSKLATNT